MLEDCAFRTLRTLRLICFVRCCAAIERDTNKGYVAVVVVTLVWRGFKAIVDDLNTEL